MVSSAASAHRLRLTGYPVRRTFLKSWATWKAGRGKGFWNVRAIALYTGSRRSDGTADPCR